MTQVLNDYNLSLAEELVQLVQLVLSPTTLAQRGKGIVLFGEFLD